MAKGDEGRLSEVEELGDGDYYLLLSFMNCYLNTGHVVDSMILTASEESIFKWGLGMRSLNRMLCFAKIPCRFLDR